MKSRFEVYFIKKETLVHVFHVNFAKFLRTPFLQNTSGQLLLKVYTSILSMNLFNKHYEIAIVLLEVIV